MSIEAPEFYEIAKSATRTLLVSFDKQLEAGEVLSGTPTFTEVGTAYLTIDNAQLNATAVDVHGRSVAIGRVALARCASSTGDVTAQVRVSCATDGNQTVVMLINVRIVEDGS